MPPRDTTGQERRDADLVARRRAAMALYEQFGLRPISGGDGSDDDPPKDDPKDPKDPKDPPKDPKAQRDADLADLEVGDKGKAAIVKERDARDAAAKRATAAEAELETLRKEKADRDKADKAAADKKAAEDGQFQTLAEERATEIVTLTTDRDDWKGKYATALEQLKPGVEAAWKDLPKEVVELYDGEADDVLAKQAHLSKTAKLVERLTKAKVPGNPTLPKDGKVGDLNKDDISAPLSPKQIVG